MRPKPQAKDNAKGIKGKEEARGDVNCDVDLRGGWGEKKKRASRESPDDFLPDHLRCQCP
jgi:hypothetical protein